MQKLKHFVLVTITLLIPTAVLAGASPSPEDTVAAFHQALKEGQKERIKGHVTSNVVIFEGGGVENSFAEYASHHLAADIEFSKATTRTVADSNTHLAGDVAWVLSRGTTTGSFRGKDINTRFTETMVLKRAHGHWRIAHIHWSSRSGSRAQQ